jgi:hypothetical protein
MRSSVLLLTLSVWSSNASAKPTTTIEERSVAALVGCWQLADKQLGDERWIFRKRGDHRLEVVREISDAGYADRARIPREVRFDPQDHAFSFEAAGQIHALLMVFEIGAAGLEAWSYSDRDTGKYAWTGNRFRLVTCKRKP